MIETLPRRRATAGWALAAGLLMLALPFAGLAQAPVPKAGSCPSGYHTSGAYCAPSSAHARPALPKVGSYPSAYHTSGDYCLGKGRLFVSTLSPNHHASVRSTLCIGPAAPELLS